jgi:uncharacterized protein YecT (DUF1311 family)
MFTLLAMLLLTACQNSAEETSGTPTKEGRSKTTSDRDSTTDDLDLNEDKDSSNQTATTKETTSTKEVYLQKLADTKKQTADMEAVDTSTYALKHVENERYEAWDKLLNEIYGVLKQQLSSEDMDQLRKEQRDWIADRDATAKEASMKYEGGTMEHLEYVAVLANLTKERAYILVEVYM